MAGCIRVGSDGNVYAGGGGGAGAGDASVDAPLTTCADPVVLTGPGIYHAVLADAGDGGATGGCDEPSAGAAFQIDLAAASWVYLDTLDSPPGTALSLRTEMCDAEIVACSDAACGLFAGQLLVPLAAGRYFARVDGPAGETLALRYQLSSCDAAPLPLGSTPGVMGACGGGAAGSCGGGPTTFCAAGVAESVWVLAGCGLDVQIDTCVGTFFDSVLYLRSGDCDGPEVVCLDANSCGDGDDEVLAGVLGPGMYFLFVDSDSFWSASYNLGVE